MRIGTIKEREAPKQIKREERQMERDRREKGEKVIDELYG